MCDSGNDDCGIHVVLGSDENFAMPLTVAMTSVLCNTNSLIYFHILTNGFKEATLKRIMNVKKHGECVIDIVNFDPSDFNDFPSPERISEIAYARIRIPELFKSLSRVIYMDCDMICVRDIRELWNTDLEDNMVGACSDFRSVHKTKHIGIDPRNYFNSGLIMMDLDKIRTMDYNENTQEITDKGIFTNDQDLLNCLFAGTWKPLHTRWNLFADINVNRIKRKGMFDVDILKDALSHPGIIHYTGIKPWSYRYKRRFKKQFFSYLAKTDFNSFSYPDKNFSNFIYKNSPSFLVKLYRSLSKRLKFLKKMSAN